MLLRLSHLMVILSLLMLLMINATKNCTKVTFKHKGKALASKSGPSPYTQYRVKEAINSDLAMDVSDKEEDLFEPAESDYALPNQEDFENSAFVVLGI
ncbi:hypothetical protein M0R45_006576 [Rubus argutus]|uniref:Uncharacterized protein n=1 Tax=Rubus argutus TaxID=59490 RepID=A0AAW1YRK2_RUBAR